MAEFKYPLRFRSKHTGKVVEFETLSTGCQVFDDGSYSLTSTWIYHTVESKWVLVNNTKRLIMAKLGDYRGTCNNKE